MIRWYRYSSSSQDEQDGLSMLGAVFGFHSVMIRPVRGWYHMQLVHVRNPDIVLLTELFDTEEAAKERGERLLVMES